MKQVWYCPSSNVLGIVTGDFIEFRWNDRPEKSYFALLRDEGLWVYVGEL